MPVSKKDIARVLTGEKRARAWKTFIQATPPNNPVDKDGNRKQVRLRGLQGCMREPQGPEIVDKERAIRSGGVTPDVSMRSADGKFAKSHREFSGDMYQGKVQVSTIDGHVYGSVQKVGRSLDEYARDMGMGPVGQLIGKGKGYEPAPVPAKRNKPSPFKRRWQESTFEVIKK